MGYKRCGPAPVVHSCVPEASPASWAGPPRPPSCRWARPGCPCGGPPGTTPAGTPGLHPAPSPPVTATRHAGRFPAPAMPIVRCTFLAKAWQCVGYVNRVTTHNNETVKWLSPLSILMWESFWWWQCSNRHMVSLFPHLHTLFPSFSPSLISLMISVDVKHHVHLLTL